MCVFVPNFLSEYFVVQRPDVKFTQLHKQIKVVKREPLYNVHSGAVLCKFLLCKVRQIYELVQESGGRL